MQVLNLKNYKEQGSNDTYIGRGSQASNPFAMSDFRNDRNLVVSLHREYFLSQLANSTDVAKFIWSIPIDNNVLCYCNPLACHGDVIAEFRNETKGMEFKEARAYFLRKYDYEFLPQLESITHINIYSKSLTDLGKMTSNFAYSPFEHPKYGRFNSMEAFWFYVGTGFQYGELRNLHGMQAKAMGSKIPKVQVDNFEGLIEEGIRCKVEQTPILQQMLTENHLPFKHYVFYGNVDNCKVIKGAGGGLLERTYSQISRELGVSYKVIIAGSRTIADIRWLTRLVVDSKYRISEIVEGGAKGVDTFGMWYGVVNNIPIKTMAVTKEEWAASKAAGMIRNGEMGKYADRAIIGIENNSRGSTEMAKITDRLGKDNFVRHYETSRSN